MSPVLFVFAFACVLGENWKTRKNGKVLYEAIFRLKPILSKHPIFQDVRSFLPKVMTTAAWAAAWSPL